MLLLLRSKRMIKQTTEDHYSRQVTLIYGLIFSVSEILGSNSPGEGSSKRDADLSHRSEDGDISRRSEELEGWN